MQLFFQEQRVGAEINVLFPRNQPLDDFVDLRVHQRFAAGDRNHRRSAFIHGFEAFFRRQFRFQNVRRILDLAATGAGQVAAKERLQHQHERIALAPRELLFQDVRCNRPRL